MPTTSVVLGFTPGSSRPCCWKMRSRWKGVIDWGCQVLESWWFNKSPKNMIWEEMIFGEFFFVFFLWMFCFLLKNLQWEHVCFSHRPWKASIQTRALLLFVGLWYGTSGWCHKKQLDCLQGHATKLMPRQKQGIWRWISYCHVSLAESQWVNVPRPWKASFWFNASGIATVFWLVLLGYLSFMELGWQVFP